jgi:hypothetical protein
MTSNRNAQGGEPPAVVGDDDADFGDEELSPMSDEEVRESNLRSEIFLEQERAEREALAEQFEEELDALFATIKPGEADPEEDEGGDVPPGWPDL